MKRLLLALVLTACAAPQAEKPKPTTTSVPLTPEPTIEIPAGEWPASLKGAKAIALVESHGADGDAFREFGRAFSDVFFGPESPFQEAKEEAGWFVAALDLTVVQGKTISGHAVGDLRHPADGYARKVLVEHEQPATADLLATYVKTEAAVLGKAVARELLRELKKNPPESP